MKKKLIWKWLWFFFLAIAFHFPLTITLVNAKTPRVLATLLSYGVRQQFQTPSSNEHSETIAELNRTYGGADSDVFYSVQQTSDGGYIAAGYTESSSAGREDYWLVKTDAYGDVEWNKTYGGPRMEGVFSVQQTSDGGYILTGEHEVGLLDTDIPLIKTDAYGEMEWYKSFGGSSLERAWSVQQVSDGGYILAGSTRSFGAGSRDYWLIKTDALGNMEWNKTYGGADDDQAYSVQQTSDGGYIVVGSADSYRTGIFFGEIWVIKTDEYGEVEWSRISGWSDWDFAHSVQQTSDGGYIIAGTRFSSYDTRYDFWLIKLDSNGTYMWDGVYASLGAEEDVAECVRQTIDGGYIVAGGGGSYDFWLVKTDAYGIVEWNRTFGGHRRETAFSVQQTSDGGYIVAGDTESFGLGQNGYPDGWLVKFFPVHDVAISGIDPAKNNVAQGSSLQINVTVENPGFFAEDVNATLYVNGSAVGSGTVYNLSPEASGILTFTWNTTGYALGNYTLSAYALPVLNETDTADNTYIDGVITVRSPLHDVAAVAVQPTSDVVSQGFNLSINVTVENQGDFPETFNVTACANSTAIGIQEVLLDLEEFAVLVFVWNTTGFSLGNYTISAHADQVAEEADPSDNICVDGVVTVRLPVHDVAVFEVEVLKSVVGEGYLASVNVTVENQGDFLETLNVTVFVNGTLTGNVTLVLAREDVASVTIVWNTTGLAKGGYLMAGYVSPVLGEVDLADNMLVEGWMFVSIPGDVDGDRDVDIFDIVAIVGSYSTQEGDQLYILNYDIDYDGKVDIFDIVIAVQNYRENWS